jgi:hypothetical protein
MRWTENDTREYWRMIVYSTLLVSWYVDLVWMVGQACVKLGLV